MEQAGVEAVEGIVWQAGEQLAREPAVTIKECLGGSASPLGEGDQCRAAVGGMRFAGHEPGGHQAVDQSSDVARRDVQVGGQRALGARSALLKPPYVFGRNALINANYNGFKVVWTASVVPSYSAIPSPWIVIVTYTNITSSTSPWFANESSGMHATPLGDSLLRHWGP